LLVALYDGSAIQVISAEGALESIIHLPVKRPTSCTFIGRNLDNLVVTSASLDTETELHNGVGKTLLLTDLDFAGKKAYSFGISIMD
jgi:sugar lactone lactonase YvrE